MILQNWQINLPDVQHQWPLCSAFGCIWIANGFDLDGYDEVTGERRYHFTGFGADPADPASVRNAQPCGNGLLIFGSDLYVYWVSLENNHKELIFRTQRTVFWFVAHEGAVWIADPDDGLIKVAPPVEGHPTPTIVARQKDLNVADKPTFLPGQALFRNYRAASGDQIIALDAETLAVLWSSPVDKISFTNFEAQGTNNGQFLFSYDAENKTIFAFSIFEKRVVWRRTLPAKPSAALQCDANRVFVPLENSTIVVLEAATGKDVKSPIKLEKPLVYSTAFADDCLIGSDYETEIYAIKVSTGNVVRKSGYRAPFLAGFVNGVAYFTNRHFLSADRLTVLAKQFYAESTLLQDLVFNNGPEPKKIPAVETEITLRDESGAPRPLSPVRVHATGKARIVVAGVMYDIDEKKGADLTTDSAGRLRIKLPMERHNHGQSIGEALYLPSYVVYASFMDPRTRMLVRPDGQLQDKAAHITGSDLAKARGFDGKSIIRDEYQGNQKALHDVANTIARTVGIVQTSVERRGDMLSTPINQYLQQGCDMTQICCCPKDMYDCKVICDQNFAFSFVPGHTSFELCDQRATEEWLKKNPLTQGLSEDEEQSYNLWEAIVSGAVKIADGIIYATNKIGGAVYFRVKIWENDHPKVKEFILNTTEKALQAAMAFVNRVVRGVRSFLEFLTQVFDWDAILALKRTIRQGIEGSYTKMFIGDGPSNPAMLNRVSDELIKAISSLEAHADKALVDLSARVRGMTPESVQSQGARGKNPSNGSSSHNWLQSRMEENLLGRHVPDTYGNSPYIDTSVGFSWPKFTMPATASQEIEELIRSAKGKVSDDVMNALTQIRSSFGDTSGGFFSRALGAMIEALRGAVAVSTHAATILTRGLMKLIGIISKAIWEFVSTPLDDIPFLSHFYSWITHGDKLSLLDLVCLIAAVPAHLTMTSIHGQARTDDWPPMKIAGLVAGILQGIWGVVGTIVAGGNLIPAVRKKSYWNSARFGAIAAFGLVGARFGILWSLLESLDGPSVIPSAIIWVVGSTALTVDACIAAYLWLGKPPAGVPLESIDFVLPFISLSVGSLCAILWAGLFVWLTLAEPKFSVPVLVFNACALLALQVRVFAFPSAPATVAWPAVIASGALVVTSGVFKVLGALGILEEEGPEVIAAT